MFDGSTETFEMIKRPNTAEVIATVGDKILLLNQEQPNRPKPFTSLPGGRCEEGEDPLVATQRELLEETGYTSSDWELWQAERPQNKIIWTVYTYIARNCRLEQPPKLDAGEKITAKLITFDEFILLSDDEDFYELELKKYLFRARLDAKSREDLHNLLFKK